MSKFARVAIVTLALAAHAPIAQASPCAGTAVPTAVSNLSDNVLTVDALLNRIRSLSPAVLSAGLEARALSAEADQASRRLNPVLSFEAENFAGGGRFSGFGETETTLALEQTFRLGNKRTLSERAARARQALASAECEVILRETELEATLMLAELVSAKTLKDLAKSNATLAQQLTEIVGRRVEAGAAAPPELMRARADAARAKAQVEAAGLEIERLRSALGLLWAEANPRFHVPGTLSFGTDSSHLDRSTSHPATARAEAALAVRRAEADEARSAALPDVTVSAGIRRFEESGDQAFIAGLSVPLPIFDRGRDRSRATSIRSEIALLDQARSKRRLIADQTIAISARRVAQSRLTILEDQALPAAAEAYRAAVRGYEIGRFDLTTTLNARTAYLDAQLAVARARHELTIQDLRLRALSGAAPFDGAIQ